MISFTLRGAISLLCLLLLVSIARSETLRSGEYVIKQSWSQEENYDRQYIVEVPATNTRKKHPVLIFLHGNGGNADRSRMNIMRRYQSIASQYIMVFPNGYAKSWNIVSERSKANDRQFIEQIVRHIASHENAQSDQFTIMGNSNGSALANQLAIETRLPNIRNFITVVSPLNLWQHDGKSFRSRGEDNNYAQIADPLRGKRILNISGTEDRLIPYQGGASPVIPAKNEKLAFLAAEESTYLWAQHMGYQGSRLTEPSSAMGSLDFFRYLNGDVIHIKVNGGGHGAGGAVSEQILLDFLNGSQPDRTAGKTANSE